MRKILFILGCCLYAGTVWAGTGAALLAQAKLETDPHARIKLLTSAISEAPLLADAYHYRADAYLSVGRSKQALEDYTRTIQLRPKDPFRYYARGLAYANLQRYSRALADLNEAIELKPSYKKFYLARAQVYLKMEKYEQAVSDYEKGRKAVTKDFPVLDMLPAYIATYRYDKALRLLDSAADNDSAKNHYWRGRVYWGRNEVDEAVSSFSKAINRDPSFAPAYRYRANAFKEMGDLQASLADYTTLLSLQPEALFYNRRGLIEEELGELKQAQQDYTKATELNPKWAIPFNNRGFVRIRLKDWEAAKKDLETAILLDDTLPTPHINLAGVYWLSKKDRKQAYAHLDRALRLNFKDVESLYNEEQKGWMFKGLNQTAQFRALLYK